MGLSSKQVSADILDFSQIGGDLDIMNVEMKDDHHHYQQQQQEEEKKPKCPRCDSTNTKFCYYNNYSKLQPRHFCRSCKRHWTQGGTLRNVPVGGRQRKNKRARTRNDNNDDDGDAKVNGTQQQQPTAAPLSETVIFPDVFGQVMCQPQTLRYLLPEFGCNSPNSASSSLGTHSLQGQELVGSSEENMLGLMNGYSGAPWLQDSWAQASPYHWNSWDGMMDINASASNKSL